MVSSSIQPLPAEVIAQIKSSVTITCLNSVILGLLKNSLDASAHRVNITVDYRRGGCTVEDNGVGISPSEFRPDGGLAKLYHSSKCGGETGFHGSHGAFLASVAALSMVTITAHHHLHRSHNSISLNHSEVIARQTPAPQQQYLYFLDHGTRVVVRDLFGNMPVRVKQRIIDNAQNGRQREWDELKRSVISVMLAWPKSVFVSLRDSASGKKLQLREPSDHISLSSSGQDPRLLSHVCNILSQSDVCSSPDRKSWISMCAESSNVSIRAAISLKPVPTKHAQFISLGIHPVENTGGHNILYEDINRLFVNSSFGNEDLPDLDDGELMREFDDQRYKSHGFTDKELRGSGKGVDKWPMFYINIRTLNSHLKETIDIDSTEPNRDVLEEVMNLSRAMILEFLKAHDFQYTISRGTHSNGSRSIANTILSPYNGGYGDINPGTLEVKGSKQKILSKEAAGRSLSRPGRGVLNRSESPFNSWSRIKSGKSVKRHGSCESPLPDRKHVLLQRPLTAPPELEMPTSRMLTLRRENFKAYVQEIGIRSSSTQINPKKYIISDSKTLDKSGKVVRRPFSEQNSNLRETEIPSTPATVAVQEDSIGLSEILESDKVETIPWFDPSTKTQYQVSSRTGFIEKAQKKQNENLASSSSSLAHLGSQKPTFFSSKENLKPTTETGSWISQVLQNWENPVFLPVETAIPQVFTSEPDSKLQKMLQSHWHNCLGVNVDQAFCVSSSGPTTRLSKEGLLQAEIISQVDLKFILAKVPVFTTVNTYSHPAGTMLVIIDQHAADERCRIEQLMSELCEKPDSVTMPRVEEPFPPGVRTRGLEKAITFEVSRPELHLLRLYQEHFANWGILYILPKTAVLHEQQQQLSVISLPPGIFERCRLDQKLLIELIRSEVWKYKEQGIQSFLHRAINPSVREETYENSSHQWLRKIHDCPEGIINILNSRSCRSAIMFNDELSQAQCETLVRQLAQCAFPFQCAHGRPSMIPLVDMVSFVQQNEVQSNVKLYRFMDFGASFATWKESLQMSPA